MTWASLATGVPFEKHGIYWYGDPKPEEFPLYWQAASEHRRVGFIGTLHSSPLDPRTALRYDFAVPDPFATDPTTVPASLERFQRFNLAMTKGNGRATSLTRPSIADGLAVASALKEGVRLRTAGRIGALVASIAAGKVAKERLRVAQYLLLEDPFVEQLEQTEPDLAILFTNHLAAAMHRYWYASFPDDWEEELYDPAWVERFQGEIPFALDELDRGLARLLTWCEANDRALVVMGSMGQTGGGQADDRTPTALVVDDVGSFAAALGIRAPYIVRQAMVPHVTLEFDNPDTAGDVTRHLESLDLDGPGLDIDLNQSTVTITYHLEAAGDGVRIGDQVHPFSALGIESVTVDEHRNGTHDPRGAFIVANAPDADLGDGLFDVLEVAPAILVALGLEPLDHHRTPSIRI